MISHFSKPDKTHENYSSGSIRYNILHHLLIELDLIKSIINFLHQYWMILFFRVCANHFKSISASAYHFWSSREINPGHKNLLCLPPEHVIINYVIVLVQKWEINGIQNMNPTAHLHVGLIPSGNNLILSSSNNLWDFNLEGANKLSHLSEKQPGNRQVRLAFRDHYRFYILLVLKAC